MTLASMALSESAAGGTSSALAWPCCMKRLPCTEVQTAVGRPQPSTTSDLLRVLIWETRYAGIDYFRRALKIRRELGMLDAERNTLAALAEAYAQTHSSHDRERALVRIVRATGPIRPVERRPTCTSASSRSRE